jgi:hypothetical protein
MATSVVGRFMAGPFACTVLAKTRISRTGIVVINVLFFTVNTSPESCLSL